MDEAIKQQAADKQQRHTNFYFSYINNCSFQSPGLMPPHKG
jgi:hypothetical protein